MRSEEEFIAAIDCRFPYEDEAAAEALITEGCRLSPNAAFMVVHELARRPRSSQASDATCLRLLGLVGARFEHPLKDLVLDVARRMILEIPLGFFEWSAIMRAIGEHPNQHNVLAVVYFSCDDDDRQERIDELYNQILDAWKAP